MMSNNETSMNDKDILYLLNENNVLVNEEDIYNIISKYNPYILKKKITNFKLFQEALTHRSYIIRDGREDMNRQFMKEIEKDREMEPIKNPDIAVPLQKNSYERLEFLGDAVIHMILAAYLYNRYENKYEGFLTRLRIKLENKEFLAKIGKDYLGLDRYVLISKRLEVTEARIKNPNIMEDCVESFVGAMYENFGYDDCYIFISNLLEDIDFTTILKNETNYKDTLLQYYHKNKWGNPTYDTYDIKESENERIFVMCVYDRFGKPIAFGEGLSKKKGEQEAAKKALIIYNEIEDENSSDHSSDSGSYLSIDPNDSILSESDDESSDDSEN